MQQDPKPVLFTSKAISLRFVMMFTLLSFYLSSKQSQIKIPAKCYMHVLSLPTATHMFVCRHGLRYASPTVGYQVTCTNHTIFIM